MDRITSLNHIEDFGKKVCIYGLSGSGKTRLASTFAVEGPLLHMICSSNKTNEARSIKGTEGVDVVQIQQAEDLEELVEFQRSSGKYTTLVLDHVTEFCQNVLAGITGRERMPEQSSWGLATMQQYQQMGSQTKEYLRDLLDLDCNVIIIGQERTYNTSEEGDSGDIVSPYVSVAATPAVAGWIAPACDYMIQAFKRRKTTVTQKNFNGKIKKVTKQTNEVEYCLRTGPDPVYMTKFRTPRGVTIPDVIVVPDTDDGGYNQLREFMEA